MSSFQENLVFDAIVISLSLTVLFLGIGYFLEEYCGKELLASFFYQKGVVCFFICAVLLVGRSFFCQW